MEAAWPRSTAGPAFVSTAAPPQGRPSLQMPDLRRGLRWGEALLSTSSPCFPLQGSAQRSSESRHHTMRSVVAPWLYLLLSFDYNKT